MTAARPRYSVVIPVHDEAEILPQLYERLSTVLDGLEGDWELILVDDGSRDGSYALMVELHGRDPRVRGLRFSRNFGHQVALTAGLDRALGEAVITMDGDLQHPPETIPELVARWQEGNEIVYGVMSARVGESWFKRTTSTAFYRLLRRLTDVEMPAAAGDFRLVDRKALDAFRALRESNRYVRGMFSWIGFSQAGVPYVCAERPGGRSKYTARRMLKLASDAIVGFSTLPLRLALNVGFVVSILSIVFGLSALATKLAGGFAVPGWASIMILVGLVGGIQLIVIGVIGEYIGRIYDEVKQRPLYLVSASHGFEE
jgi:polyisoprenyl-phosphate glycosyltransferase